MKYSEQQLAEIVSNASHGQAEFDSVVDGKVLCRTTGGAYRTMSMGHIAQAEARMNLQVEREAKQAINREAKANVQAERIDAELSKQAQADKSTADSNAKRDRHNSEGNFSQGYEV